MEEQYTNFHFEYALESQRYELEGEEYTGFGVLVKMVDEHGIEDVMSIQDITPKQEVARDLIQLLNSFKVSPKCLKIFLGDFLINM